MRKIWVIIVGLLALIAVAACAPIPEPDQATTPTTATPQADATATSQPNATAAPALQRKNIAVLGTGSASAGEGSAQLAIDGNPDTVWNSLGLPPQWLSIAVDDFYLVDRIEMVITQTPAGPTTHEIWLGNGSGTPALYKRLTDVHTEDGQTLEVAIEPPRSINEVLIRTLDSPSWVAWREVRVFGSPSANPEEPVESSSNLSAKAAEQERTESVTAELLLGNVAALGSGRGSKRNQRGHLVIDTESAYRAIDGDPDTVWSSKQHAPQWFSTVFNDLYLVDRVEMVVAQAPAGPTTHEIWLGHGSGTRTLYKRLPDVHTEDGQTLSVTIEPPQNIDEVLILTVHSPSWVAWREVKVFGSPSANPVAAEGAPRLKLNRVTTGLKLPIQVTHAGDSSGRLFVVEQGGIIRIVRNGVAPNSGAAGSDGDAPFLDISDRVSCCREQGLIGIAFPPTFAAKQQFYVNYTNVDGDTVISRFTTTTDPDRADPDSEEVVLAFDQPHQIHNGGRLVFGTKDGYLYIGSGDGGSDGPPRRTGQDPTTLLGKMLRIDVESGVRPYSIPASNPFRHEDGYREEIWAIGLRNPWGFAFDQQTGDLYLPDVGNANNEEVNYQPAGSLGGENYGWPIMEGSLCLEHSSMPCRSDKNLILPVAEYDRSQGCAIVGGAVYRGTRIPGMRGLFIYADFCTGRIWGLKHSDADLNRNVQYGWHSTLLAKAAVPISSIGEDEDGNVYATGYQDGVIYMLTEQKIVAFSHAIAEE